MRYFYRDVLSQDLSSQTSVTDSRFLSQARIIDGARYIAAFQRRHPIAYFVWYRYRLFLVLSPDERKSIMPEIKYRLRCGAASYDPADPLDDFALWHPVLFLFVDAFQFGKKLVSAVRQKVSSLFYRFRMSENETDKNNSQ